MTFGKYFISVAHLTRKDLDELFDAADQCKRMVDSGQGVSNVLAGRVLATLFYEPSTRTSCSFQAAMLRLGGKVFAIASDTSSVVKGETLQDTIRTVESYADFIVIRHPQKGSAAIAAETSRNAAVLNAGDGIGEHPSQALLDLYTIRNELGKIDGLTITMLGDLKNGRTVHSLAKLLSLFNVKLNYVSPDVLKMPQDVIKSIKAANGRIEQQEFSQLDKVLAQTDVLYVTRVQKERFSKIEEYDAVKSAFIVSPQLLTKLKSKSSLVILHPLPRTVEITPEVDSDPRAAYFRQMRNGMFVRMALLCKLGNVKFPLVLPPLPKM